MQGKISIDLCYQRNVTTQSRRAALKGTDVMLQMTMAEMLLRYYIIDLRALLLIFNLSQASASTVGPVDTKICMVNLPIFWSSNTFIKIKFWVVILQDKFFPGSMM